MYITAFRCMYWLSSQAIHLQHRCALDIVAEISAHDKLVEPRKASFLLDLAAALSPPDSDSINFMLGQGMRWYGAISTILFGVVALG